ncbi:MAG: hypothetical protein LBG05_02965 [Treponema sp.]|jgi:hypothetical protein|nr:hypothetical protein [Treponema sp.]
MPYGLDLPSIEVANLVTLSGTVAAEINGDWTAADKLLSVGVTGLDQYEQSVAPS